MKWFRFYHEALDDPKVQMLPPELFKTWVNLLCIASRETLRGTLPETSVLAFQLRISNEQVTEAVSDLIERGLLDENEHGELEPHNWQERQPESDDVAQRVAKFRAKQQEKQDKKPQRTRNVTGNVSVTPPEEKRRDTDTEEKRKTVATKKSSQSSSPVPLEQPYGLYVALCEEIGADESELAPSFKGQQLGIAKQLIDDGFGEDRVRKCIRYLRSQDWRTSPIDLRTVKNEIGRWEANGEPSLATKPKNGRPTTADHNAVIDEFQLDLRNINQGRH